MSPRKRRVGICIFAGIIFFTLVAIFCLQRQIIPLNSISSLFTQTSSVPSPSTSMGKILPFVVNASMGTEWFETWAEPQDVMVVFGERNDFSSIPRPLTGKVAWNVPSFEYVQETKSLWKNKIDVIIYDYELWDKTPQAEKDDPGGTAAAFQTFADEQGVELIFGSSFRMIVRGVSTEKIREQAGNIDWEQHIDIEKIQTIAGRVQNFGVNATGLRSEYPESYIDFFQTVARYAREANPEIALWPVVDARSQSAQTMFEILSELGGDANGVVIMGGETEKDAILELVGYRKK